jgi:hypothetical protein
LGVTEGNGSSGAVIGLADSSLLIYLVQGIEQSELPTFHWLVIVGIVPGILELVILFLVVRPKTEKGR